MEPDDLQGPLRIVDAEGIHQRRTRPALRGDRAQHQTARPGSHPGQVRADHRPADRHGRPVHQHARLRRIAYLPDGTLDQLPAPANLGETRIGGIDTNQPRMRSALAAALALAVAPQGFTVAEFTAQVQAITGQTPENYSVRQAAYDLRKLRGKQLIIKPGRTRRYHVPGDAARTIAAILTLRDQVIAPLIAGSAHHTRPAAQNWTTSRPRLRNPPPRNENPIRPISASRPAPPHRQQLVDRPAASRWSRGCFVGSECRSHPPSRTGEPAGARPIRCCGSTPWPS